MRLILYKNFNGILKKTLHPVNIFAVNSCSAIDCTAPHSQKEVTRYALGVRRLLACHQQGLASILPQYQDVYPFRVWIEASHMKKVGLFFPHYKAELLSCIFYDRNFCRTICEGFWWLKEVRYVITGFSWIYLAVTCRCRITRTRLLYIAPRLMIPSCPKKSSSFKCLITVIWQLPC